MDYKDLILLLLSSRGEIICKEDMILAEFKNPEKWKSFRRWCRNNKIMFRRIEDQQIIKLINKQH